MLQIKIELDIAAQKVMHSLQTHNAEVEKSIERGIRSALEELTKDDGFELMVKNRTKQIIVEMVDKNIMSWDMRDKLQKAFNDAMQNKIKDYAEAIAEKFTNHLDKP